MREGGEIQAVNRIDQQRGFVAVDFRGCGSRELSETYQAFALLCAREEVRWALVKTGDEDAESHYALRDVLVTLARIAGTPLRFRLALVADSDAMVRVGRTLQKNLAPLGCDARVFRDERSANDWLRSREARQRLSVAEMLL